MSINIFSSLYILIIISFISVLVIDILSITLKYVNAQNDHVETSSDMFQYINSTYGIKIKYPSDWTIEELDYYPDDDVTSIAKLWSPFETHKDEWQESIYLEIDPISYNANLKEYLDETIDVYDEFENFEIIESTTNSKLAGHPAYSLVYTYTYTEENAEEDEESFEIKALEIGTIIDNNAYYLRYAAEIDSYSEYLDTIQNMINSFEITNMPNTNNNSPEPLSQDNASNENNNNLLNNAQGNTSLLPTLGEIILYDDFNLENNGIGFINYSEFKNWNVFEGTVDLLGPGLSDIYPGNGIYVDLDGTSYDAGRLESKEEFVLEPGTYMLEFDIAGYDTDAYQRGDADIATVQLGDIFKETFTIEKETPFEHITRSISIPSSTKAKLTFNHYGGDFYGILLDNVRLSKSNKVQQSPSAPPLSNQESPQIQQSPNSQEVDGMLLYENPKFGIKLQYPSDWQAVEGDATTYYNFSFIHSSQEGGGQIVDALVSITVYNTNMPLDEGVESYIYLISTLPEFTLLESNPTTAILGDSIPSHLIVYQFKDPITEISMEELDILLIKDNKIYIFSYATEKSKYSTYLPTVLNMLKSIEFTSISDDDSLEEQRPQQQSPNVPLRQG